LGPEPGFKANLLAVVGRTRLPAAQSAFGRVLAQGRLMGEQAAQFRDTCANQPRDVFAPDLMRFVDRLFDFSLARDLKSELRFHDICFPVVWRSCLVSKMWGAGGIANQSRYALDAWLLRRAHGIWGSEGGPPRTIGTPQLRTHTADISVAYNFARRLKTLNGLTRCE
jgi:hypothetical protein